MAASNHELIQQAGLKCGAGFWHYNCSRLQMQNHDIHDDGAPVEHAREKLHDLLVNFRKDGLRLDNPQVSALFEASAEVLAGLERAFVVEVRAGGEVTHRPCLLTSH